MLKNGVAQIFLPLQTTFEQLLSRKSSKAAKVRNQIALAKFNVAHYLRQDLVFVSSQTLRQKAVVPRTFHLNVEIRACHDFNPLNKGPPL